MKIFLNKYLFFKKIELYIPLYIIIKWNIEIDVEMLLLFIWY